MTCDLPEQVMIRRLRDRLEELDSVSKKLKSKTGIILDNGKFRNFSSKELIDKYLGQAINDYNIPMHVTDNYIEMC